MSDTKYIEASWTARFILIALVSIAIISYFWSIELGTSELASEQRTLQQLEESNARLDRTNVILEIIISVLFLAISIYFMQIGIRSLKSGQYPPPGSRVIVKTKVVTGKSALGNARGNLAAGLLFLAFVIWLHVHAIA
ncbi:MAG: hypothetical protein GY829_03200 [Gammaproteobacteria bacterium]|nr:hypothetical protein [Gammaproteobacteria bacterium]